MTPSASTLAFVESPVQLLNVLEWAHAEAASAPGGAPLLHGVPAQPSRAAVRGPAADGADAGATAAAAARAPDRSAGAGSWLRIVVLPPTDPMSRGQLRRMAGLARDEGYEVVWQEARGGRLAPLKALAALAKDVRAARRVVVGDPFSRYVQLLLTLVRAEELVVVDDGTATMEFVAQTARGERLVRWHHVGGGGLPGRVRELAYAPVSATARRRFTPAAGGGRRVEVFSSMPVTVHSGMTLRVNEFAWTRARFGPPRLTKGTDLVGTSLVETGVVDPDRYLDAVRALTLEHGATRYFAHRRESAQKLRTLSEATGLEIVRPDLPLELIARRGPVGRTIVSFPSTVVHTLPYALTGTGVTVAVCDVEAAWLTGSASPRARSFLAGVTETARDVHRLPAQTASAAG
ncbi:hypothetical protein CP980_13085 [Streptomyces vinaceus]|uniref:Uncharacterized protein n=1 Tax=Streptomyces vinaceus TaxID=1960 RepID=A0A5J6J8I4_STRVI|nr:hypothetical protein [Streptomyces vinaceus]QEV45901.1 hypothetical protein CP980_13085 [Streptomyces vinaceus]GHE34261.1 hypothetical protein GCM10017778_16720 [Streptomyces vinaceus]